MTSSGSRTIYILPDSKATKATTTVKHLQSCRRNILSSEKFTNNIRNYVDMEGGVNEKLLIHQPYYGRRLPPKILPSVISYHNNSQSSTTAVAPLLTSSSSLRIYQNRQQPQPQRQQSKQKIVNDTSPQRQSIGQPKLARQIFASPIRQQPYQKLVPKSPKIIQKTTMVRKPAAQKSIPIIADTSKSITHKRRFVDKPEESEIVDIDEVYDLIGECDDSNGGSFSASLNGVPRKRERLTHLTPEEKLNRRKMKNRVAAQTARDRKKERTHRLEHVVKLLLVETNRLRAENRSLRAKNQCLRNENIHQNISTNKINNSLPSPQSQLPSDIASTPNNLQTAFSSKSADVETLMHTRTAFESAAFINEPLPRDQAMFKVASNPTSMKMVLDDDLQEIFGDLFDIKINSDFDINRFCNEIIDEEIAQEAKQRFVTQEKSDCDVEQFNSLTSIYSPTPSSISATDSACSQSASCFSNKYEQQSATQSYCSTPSSIEQRQFYEDAAEFETVEQIYKTDFLEEYDETFNDQSNKMNSNLWCSPVLDLDSESFSDTMEESSNSMTFLSSSSTTSSDYLSDNNGLSEKDAKFGADFDASQNLEQLYWVPADNDDFLGNDTIETIVESNEMIHQQNYNADHDYYGFHQ